MVMGSLPAEAWDAAWAVGVRLFDSRESLPTQAVEELVHALLRDLLVVIEIHLQAGREIAIAQAFDLLQREPAVGRRLVHPAAQIGRAHV